MKRIVLISCLILMALPGFSQDYLDKIAEKCCECFTKFPDSLTAEKLQMQLGLCMIDVATPYKKELKKNNGINMDNIGSGTEGEKLGHLIGLKMAGICPEALIKLAGETKTKKAEKNLNQTVRGVVSKVENDCFVVFSVKDDTGKITKYYWLTFVESEMELTGNYATMTGKSVKITYDIQDFFDAKIKEYRQYYIVKKMVLIND